MSDPDVAQNESDVIETLAKHFLYGDTCLKFGTRGFSGYIYEGGTATGIYCEVDYVNKDNIIVKHNILGNFKILFGERYAVTKDGVFEIRTISDGTTKRFPLVGSKTST